MIRPVRPDKLALMLRVLARWGASPAAGIAAAAINHPDDPMIVDEAGTLDVRATSTGAPTRSPARLRAEGVREGDGVAIMCRNHRGFIEATLAISKLGANGLYMNTAFAAPQLADVVEREQPVALIYDEEFAGPARAGARGGQGDRAEALRRLARRTARPTTRPLEELIAATRRLRPRAPRRVEPLRDPHLGHDRRAEGRAARLSPTRSARSPRCSRGSRCAPASGR